MKEATQYCANDHISLQHLIRTGDSMSLTNPSSLHSALARAMTSLLFVSVLLVGCGGGGGGSDAVTAPPPPPPATTYTIGGSLSGLTGNGLVLQNNAGDNLNVAAKATSFTFPTAIANGAAYAVTVLTQPSNPAQTCTVSSGSGTVPGANVTMVAIACTVNVYTVGGGISGLTGSGLVLQDNAGDNLNVAAKATSFTFPTAIASGGSYAVTVLTQPSNPAQTCTVSNGSGTVTGANVTKVAITCSANVYTVGGSISGLTGSGLVMQDNAGDNLSVAAKATSFTFPTAIASGGTYAVTVLTQPSSPAQVCSVTNGTGTVGAMNISNVAVSCVSVARFVFVANSNDGMNGDVSAFKVNPNTGALTAVPGGPVTADTNPSAIAVDTTGQYVYVSNVGAGDVSIFNVDPVAGTLTFKANAYSPGTSGASIAVAPSDNYLFVGGIGNPSSTGSVTAFTLNQNSGSLNRVVSSPYQAGYAPYGLAVDPASQFVFATAAFTHFLVVYTIGSDGSLTPIAGNPFGAGAGAYGVVASPLGGASGGFVYVANGATYTVSAFSYDSTGNLTELAQSPYSAGSEPKGIAIDPAGKFLYVTNYGDFSVSSFSIDPQSGALSPVGAQVLTGNLNNVPNPGPIDVKVDPSGQFVYVVNNLDNSVSLFSASAGVLTLSATYPTGTGAIAVAID
jgi:6-phosphogluconolactonase (cycloisomerase 2 family)